MINTDFSFNSLICEQFVNNLSVFQDLIKSTENNIMRISNKIFHQHDTLLATQFQLISTQNLKAGLIAVDFKDPNLSRLITDLNR